MINKDYPADTIIRHTYSKITFILILDLYEYIQQISHSCSNKKCFGCSSNKILQQNTTDLYSTPLNF